MLLSQAFARMAGTGSASGIYKLSESMGGGKTQSMIVAGILARFPHLASLVNFKTPLPKAQPRCGGRLYRSCYRQEGLGGTGRSTWGEVPCVIVPPQKRNGGTPSRIARH